MPLKITLILLPPLGIWCALMYMVGYPWKVSGCIAASVVAVFIIIRLCYGFKRRATPAGQEEPSSDQSVVALGLPVYEYEKNYSGRAADECTVCLDEIRPKEMVKRLPACTHLYHEGCINKWLRSHRMCPVCRTPVDAAAVELDVRSDAN